MYLKQVEITGFKSFADKTRLTFEPGMIAIVGPNGCGKSNVSDSIRWVLGEQRPTQLRCAHMADVVFNGTDSRKQLGMAEVSITFADCEKTLGTEFNEVTVSRRVFRSGEGQYFINKVPSRLKDVNRLFMGTGIGTNSYSVMAQGQIDAILSSKPEDRRAVFEEAAGITKFKADRKESLRKLEQMDANITRLDDVIREVKRQIGVLQRQAGKAKRYRELHDELRGLDIFVTKKKIQDLDVRLDQVSEAISLLDSQTGEQQQAVADEEAATAQMHSQMHEIEERVNTCTEQAAQADGAFVRAQEVIKTNGERIEEYRTWAARDSLEIAEMKRQIDQMKLQVDSLEQKRVLTEQAVESEKATLDASQERFDAHREELESTRTKVTEDRRRQMACEQRTDEIRCELSEMDARQREILAKRDRLEVEHAQISEAAAGLIAARDTVAARLEGYRNAAEACEARHAELTAARNANSDELHACRDKLGRLQTEAAAKQAQLDLLKDGSEGSEDFADGSKLLLDPSNPLAAREGAILGALADKITAAPELRLAIEVALRAWLDAVVVADAAAARDLFAALLSRGSHAAARMVLSVATPPPAPVDCPLPRLLDALSVEPDFTAAAERLLGNVRLVEKAADVPADLFEKYPGVSVVSKDGSLLRADGCAELWMPDHAVSSPLARRMYVKETSGQLEALNTQLATVRSQLESATARATELEGQLATVFEELTQARRLAAQTEGEFQAVQRDAARSEERLAALASELAQVKATTAEDDGHRATLAEELGRLSAEREALSTAVQEASLRLETMESVYSELSRALTDSRIRMSSLTQQLAYTASQKEDVEKRIAEQEKTMRGRGDGVDSYNAGIAKLQTEIEQLTASLEPLQAASEELHHKIDDLRAERAAKQTEVERAEATLSERRRMLDAARDNRTKAELDRQESTMLRKNHYERIANEYGLDERQFLAEPDPAWKGEIPPMPEIEARVSKLSSDIQALGPVNLVAIDEYKELEERYSFLKAQEEDLTTSRANLLDTIAQNNEQAFQKFKTTFDLANENFGKMFTKLFNGGEARLVMLENPEDPLDCGVDIIARPPGKRPQSVTLLSGGERTMTAVSLLFAIFMIKPAPFCILDELDAALDDSNIGRFVDALKGFLEHSQFLIITHNQHTIAGSDMVYGVTQQEKGVSKVFSIALSEVGKLRLGRK